MKAEQLGFDLNAMIEPKSHADFMMLAAEALHEFERFSGHMQAILSGAEVPAL